MEYPCVFRTIKYKYVYVNINAMNYNVLSIYSDKIKKEFMLYVN
jgi:hypothetical protein